MSKTNKSRAQPLFAPARKQSVSNLFSRVDVAIIVMAVPTLYRQNYGVTTEQRVFGPHGGRVMIEALLFPGGHPSKYWAGPTLLNFGDRTRTGALSVVWP